MRVCAVGFIHQSAVTNSMHVQSIYTPHLQYLQSEANLESSGTSAVRLFYKNSQRVKATATEHKYDKLRIKNWPPTGTELESSRLVTNGHNHYTQLLLRKVIIFYVPIHKVLEQPWRYFTSLKLCKCPQIRHPSTRVSSTFCRWHMLRFDTSYKGGKPFLLILKLLGFTCVICCN